MSPDEARSVGGDVTVPTTRVTATFDAGALFKRPRYTELVRSARTLQDDHAEAAVVMVQSAVEVFVTRAFDALLAHHGVGAHVIQEVAACIPDRTFQDKKTRDLWTALTGSKISDAPTWKQFHKEVERRNRVVHAGEEVERNDTAGAIDAAVGLITFMQKVMRPILKPDAS
jgi:hypothetical protein